MFLTAATKAGADERRRKYKNRLVPAQSKYSKKQQPVVGNVGVIVQLVDSATINDFFTLLKLFFSFYKNQ